MFYSATLVRYVLVEAENEAEAREKAAPLFVNLWPGMRDQPSDIATVRPATADEVELWTRHEAKVREEAKRGRATFFVATLARYALVQAENETEARERLAKGQPLKIIAMRPATAEEIEVWTWHNEMVERMAVTSKVMSIPPLLSHCIPVSSAIRTVCPPRSTI